MIRNTCLSSICYNLFRASQKLCRASKNHELLARHGKLVLKIMLVPVTVSYFVIFQVFRMVLYQTLIILHVYLYCGSCISYFVVLQVFFRAGALAQLEDSRDEKISDIVVAFQGYARGYLGRENLKKLKVRLPSNHSLSQQGVWALHRHPNPQKSPFRTPPPKSKGNFLNVNFKHIIDFFSPQYKFP